MSINDPKLRDLERFMTDRRAAAIILAAGQGTRMKSSRSKVMHTLAGAPMIQHILSSLDAAGVSDICIVIGPGMDILADAVAPHKTIIQHDRMGTAHAALCAQDAINMPVDDLLILNGDNPLIPAADIEALLTARRGPEDPAAVVLGFHAQTPGPYGRMIVNGDNQLERIVEAKDASADELDIDFCSSGMMALDGRTGFAMLAEIQNNNAQGEYYLPDVISVATRHDRTCVAIAGNEADLLGINSRAEMAVAEARVQDKLRQKALDGGATLIDPNTVFLSSDTQIGKDVLIEPNVFFGPGVTIDDDVHVKAFSHIEGTHLNAGATVGPFARLRPGTRVGPNVKIGNFVETKNAVLADGAKVSHLSYIGDADVGAAANIGAGTITCNYDGFFKSRTTIGADAFIGSNTALVAPVTIGDGATVGAGSTVSSDVSADALAVTRAQQREIKDWARKDRERKRALKEKG